MSQGFWGFCCCGNIFSYWWIWIVRRELICFWFCQWYLDAWFPNACYCEGYWGIWGITYHNNTNHAYHAWKKPTQRKCGHFCSVRDQLILPISPWFTALALVDYVITSQPVCQTYIIGQVHNMTTEHNNVFIVWNILYPMRSLVASVCVMLNSVNETKSNRSYDIS